MSYKIIVFQNKKENVFEFYDYINFKESFLELKKVNLDFDYTLCKEDIDFESLIDFLSINNNGLKSDIEKTLEKDNIFSTEKLLEWISSAQLLDDAINDSIVI